jgi:rhodanese-related sulfurtransferase
MIAGITTLFMIVFFTDLDFSRTTKRAPNTEVIAYCRIGERSSHTWFVLKYLLGYPNVKNYDGSLFLETIHLIQKCIHHNET